MIRFDPRVCAQCGAALVRRQNEDACKFSKRKYCSVTCTSRSRWPDDDTRFWAKVDRRAPDECWPWQGGRTARGYGFLSINNQTHRAHRYALTSTGIDVPVGSVVLHLCDNPPCCNPAHLKVGSALENNRDMVAKGRSRNRHTGKLSCA